MNKHIIFKLCSRYAASILLLPWRFIKNANKFIADNLTFKYDNYKQHNMPILTRRLKIYLYKGNKSASALYLRMRSEMKWSEGMCSRSKLCMLNLKLCEQEKNWAYIHSLLRSFKLLQRNKTKRRVRFELKKVEFVCGIWSHGEGWHGPL